MSNYPQRQLATKKANGSNSTLFVLSFSTQYNKSTQFLIHSSIVCSVVLLLVSCFFMLQE